MTSSFTCKRQSLDMRLTHRVMFWFLALTLLVASAVSSVITMSAAPAHAQSCSHITVSGKATKRDGSGLKRFGVFVTLHNSPHALDKGRTNKKGGFGLSFCKSSRLRTFAQHHNGYLNLDVNLHPWGTSSGNFWVRVYTMPYRASHVPASGHYVPARTLFAGAQTKVASRSMGVETGLPDFGAFFVHPEVMFAEVGPHVTDPYTVSSSDAGSIKATIGGTKGGYGASGSLTIEDTSDFHVDKVLHSTKKHPARAVTIQPELSVSSSWTCYNPSYYGGFASGGALQCDPKSSGRWTGVVHTPKTRFVPCTQGRTPVVFMNNRTTTGFGIGAGVNFTAEVGATSPVGGITTTMKYGGATKLAYNLDQGGHKHRFCAGGNGTTLTSSSKLFISARVAAPPPTCKGTTCALKYWEVAIK